MSGGCIVLVGNPNVGKSLLFNGLTGRYADVSNFPGTTVEVMQGRYGGYRILDTPGIYGLGSFNEEERVASEVIPEADLLINIIDAAHLERDLFLSLQLLDSGIPMLIGLNMMDEAERLGRKIDVAKLSQQLGVPVYPLALARNRRGLSALLQGLEEDAACLGQADPDLLQQMNQMDIPGAATIERLLILEGDEAMARRYAVAPGRERERIYQKRREHADAIAASVIRETRRQTLLAEKISRICLNPRTGFPLLIAFLIGFYYLIGVVVAQEATYYTEKVFFEQWLTPWIRGAVSTFIDSQSWLGVILVGEHGLLTMALAYLGGLLLPLVVAFYLILSLLEDSGYLPRLAALVDRQMRRIGINGRGIIPLILGFGCVTMAGLATRILGSERERSIAVFLLGLTIPCSAQLGILMSLTTRLGAVYSLAYFLILILVFLATGFLLNMILPGEASPLLIDLPTLRLPSLGNVIQKASIKTLHFMQDAAPLFCLGSLLISLLNLSGGLDRLIVLLTPLTVSWLRLPAESATIFILGMIRRDFGAAGLLALPLSAPQTLVAMVVITLFVPCLASVLVFWKERGPAETLLLWVVSLALAFGLGGVLSAVLLA